MRPECDSRVIINTCRSENCLRKKSCREILIVHFMPKVFFSPVWILGWFNEMNYLVVS